MTQKQRYFLILDLWPKVCAAQGWPPNDDAKRHEIYQELYSGGSISAIRSRDFTQADIDVVIARFKALINPSDIQSQLNQLIQKRKRLEYSCQQLARRCGQYDPEAYLETILNHKFHVNALEDLTEAQLTMLQHTLAARARSKHRKARVNKIPEAVTNTF